MSIFTCCEREDETKYIHPCGCPSASVVCESESVTPTLCGFEEINKSGFTPSTPPLKYRKMEIVGTGAYVLESTCDETTYNYFESTRSGTSSCERGKLDCIKTPSASSVIDSFQSRSCVDGVVEDGTSGTNTISTGANVCSQGDSNWYFGLSQVATSNISAYSLNNASNQYDDRKNTKTLSVVDLDVDAIARETPVTGTSCSSLWETRSTGFSFTVRTSGYTIECSNLAVGVEYEVIPSIRKRTAVIGSYGAWEDVTVSSTSFTATATTETIDSSGNPIALDHIQGYEYEITGVNIEKKA